MVSLTVTVTDGRGAYVTGLADRDFAVFEDGVPQPLSFFASEPVGVDLALVIDISSSMRPQLPVVQRAARGLVRSLRTHDRATVVALSNFVGIPQPLTGDQTDIASAIEGLSASGATALYDGLYTVLKELERARVGTSEIRKQALVLLSDGLDTSSRLRFEDVTELAGRAGVNIYVIALPQGTYQRGSDGEGRMLHANYSMRSLARESGGLSFFPKALRELPDVYSEIGRELAHQYELGYLPRRTEGTGQFRRVTVRVENALARTRSGYYPASASAWLSTKAGTTATPVPARLR